MWEQELKPKGGDTRGMALETARWVGLIPYCYPTQDLYERYAGWPPHEAYLHEHGAMKGILVASVFIAMK